MSRSIAMYQTIVVSICLLAGLSAAAAQPGLREHERDRSADPQASQKEAQERRGGLRGTLLAQRTQGRATETDGKGERQLSAQERNELRQQLRQQRR